MITNFNPNNKYLYSPYSYLHKISFQYKIYFILIYSCFLIYYPHIIIIFIALNGIIHIPILKYLQSKYKRKQSLYKTILLYLLILFIAIITNNQHYLSYHKYLTVYYLCIKYKSKQFIITFNSFNIPSILFKTFYLLHINLNLFNILFATTKLEIIYISLLYLFYSPKINIIIMNYLFIFSCCLSLYFLDFIINKFKDYIISIKLRKIYNYNKIHIIYFYYLMFLIKNIENDIINISYILYQRETIHKDFYLITF